MSKHVSVWCNWFLFKWNGLIALMLPGREMHSWLRGSHWQFWSTVQLLQLVFLLHTNEGLSLGQTSYSAMAPWEKQTNRRQLLELKVPNYDNSCSCSCSYGTKLNVIFLMRILWRGSSLFVFFTYNKKCVGAIFMILIWTLMWLIMRKIMKYNVCK